MSIAALARPEIVAMKPYSSARKEAPADGILLNANEFPWSLLDGHGTETLLNRYPDPQPGQLIERLAQLYQVPQDSLLVTRGSDEGIDLLTRVFCRAGQDAIVNIPPTFGMYRIAAQTQGAAIIDLPRIAAQDFAIDTAAVLRAVTQDQRVRLVFLTSPNNPTGDCVDGAFLEALLTASRERALIVVDEAYAEFCDQPSATRLMAQHPHLVVLRTLSKAWAAAGLRCGVVVAQPEVIDLLGRVIAPYPLASPVTALALRVLQPEMMVRQQTMLGEMARNKQRLIAILRNRTCVQRLWPGEANFVLVQVTDAPGLLAHCACDGVILRGYRNDPTLQGCIRISVGSQQDLAALERSLDRWDGANARRAT